MNKKYIKIFSLVGCPYSINSEIIAKEHNINCEIKHVEQQDKNMVKKENNMNTFPQIFYIDKEEDVKFTIGGNDSFESLVNLYNDCMETKNSTDEYFYTNIIKNYAKQNYGSKKYYKVISNILLMINQ